MEVSNKSDKHLIRSIIAALQHNQLAPTSEDVADALWLALKMKQVDPEKEPAPARTDIGDSSHLSEDMEQQEGQKAMSSSPKKTPPHPDRSLHTPPHPERSVHTRPRSRTSSVDKSHGIPFKSPAAPALPGGRYIERALRPFMRRVPSRTKLVFDETTTVHRIAEEEIWLPVLSSAPERWLEVALVIDESRSMVIWQQTIAELQQLLERIGAFRDVGVWYLATDTTQVQLYSNRERAVGASRPRNPDELISPTGRRLILVVSDCVAPAWRDGRVTKLLATWTDVSPVTLVQVLPQRLWPATALNQAIEVLLHAPAPSVPNKQLRTLALDLSVEELPTNGVKMPIVTLEPESLALWARMVTGAGHAWAPGLLLDSKAQMSTPYDWYKSRNPSLSPQERIRRFHFTATPMAYRLATYLAAVPLTLSVMHLVQRTMLPDSRQVHLAEVFLSGLLKQVGKPGNPDDIQYDFVDGVRDLLLNSALLPEAIDVLKRVSDFIASRVGQPFDFQALIAEPSATDGVAIAKHSRPFATIAAQLLSRFGEPYVQAAKQLEQNIERPAVQVFEVKWRSASAATPFVGRERELAQLAEYWRQAVSGRGCVVGIVGDSGVGKTRLVQAFQDEMAVYDHRWISVSCQSYEKSKTYGLLGQIIGALADFYPHDDEAARLRKLEQVVRMTDTGQLAEADIKEGVAFLSHLVDIPFSVPTVDNLKQSDQWQIWLTSVVGSVVQSQCVRQPLLLVLENLQWADEASLTILEQVVNNVGQMRLLLLATYQSEWSHQWQNQLDYKPMRLQELPDAAQRILLANLLGMVPSEELEQVILNRTGGNPFFIEEFVWSLQEDGFLTRSNDVWVPTTDLTQLPFPNNVEQAIQARLDRLSPFSRRVLQMAAIIGQKFENTVLEQILDRSERQQLNQALSTLTKRNLILRMPGWRPPIFYTFSSGLVHEIVYRLVPERFRQSVHRRIAQALRRVYQDHEEQILHRLADHYYQSSDRVNAIPYCLRAARSDAEKWANREALGWYNHGLQKLASFDDKPLTEAEADEVTPLQLTAWQVEALCGKGDVEALSGEWQRALTNYLQAESLIYELGWQPRKRADLMRRIGRQYAWGGEFEKASSWMERGRKLLEADGNEAERQVLALIDFHSASIFSQKGEFAQAEVLCQRGLSLLSQKDDRAVRAEGYNSLGTAQDMQGKYDEALDAYQTSIALWQEVGNQYEVKRVENNVAIIHSLRGEWRKAREVYLPVLAFFEKIQDRNRLAVICTSLGLLEYLQGEYEASAQRQQRAIELADDISVPWIQAPARVNLAWVHVARGEWQQAESLASESIAIETEHQSKYSLPEAYRILAEVALGRRQLNRARPHALKALDLALEQSNRLEEGSARRALGQTERLAKNREAATSHLERSLKIFEELDNRFEAARTLRQLACLKREMGAQATALSHAIRALTVFIELGAKGEADSMKAENELTFHLQRSLAEVVAFCRTEMAAVGWTEVSANETPPRTTDNDSMSLIFRHQSHQAQISLIAYTAGTSVILK